ncbi:hypothetical protein [Mycolicibacter arupensis]|uniref:Uncharacterized protein n=1 Tax=Mycolicibacter arupensis TaxID=342002 RepID=A0A5C7Y253_9MYCO|nr:hypothetical protein [Mycolicibacter arupensis]TXI55949.1 MAG: hypothetical protein E6Q54_12030 [Mycolicibacter arupensis]
MKIEWNDGWQEQIERQVAEEFIRRRQPEIDALFRRHKGKPVEEVKPILRRETSRWEGDVPDAELTRMATAISQGERVVLRHTA